MKALTVFIKTSKPPSRYLSLFESPISVSIKQGTNVTILYSDPDKTFAINRELFFQVAPYIWYSNGLKLQLLAEETDSEIQILVHSARIVKTGAAVEVYSGQQQIAKVVSDPDPPPYTQGINCLIKFSQLMSKSNTPPIERTDEQSA